MAGVATSHITLDENGVARIDGTRIKVVHVAKEKVGRGATAEQIREAFPHLSLAQIYAALSYYYDHQAEYDAQIRRELDDYKALLEKARAEGSPGRDKLRDLGRLK
jgi:uncharacterized protein (DUF433 family)